MVSGQRIRVGVLAGGASAERSISLATGLQIADHLPADRYEVVLLDPLALMVANPVLSAEQRDLAQALLAGPHAGEALPARDRDLPPAMQEVMRRASERLLPATSTFAATGGDTRIDVAFIALHGPWGEDGTLQGVLELLGIPYTGSGVLASALAMDKVMAKTVLAAAGLDVPKGLVVRSVAESRRVSAPCIVKPVEQGSSIGMTSVHTAAEIEPAIAEALRYDDRALVEEWILGTELTCGVIGNDDPLALPVIEIVSKRELFDYQAKYDPSASEEICPARIDAALTAQVQAAALQAHRALGCRGLSRTDFIWTGERLVTLEVNTMPGMTANSLLPKAARVAGIPFADLLERIIGWALEGRSVGPDGPAAGLPGEPGRR